MIDFLWEKAAACCNSTGKLMSGSDFFQMGYIQHVKRMIKWNIYEKALAKFSSKTKMPPTVIIKGGNHFLHWFESIIAQLQSSKTKKKTVNLGNGVWIILDKAESASPDYKWPLEKPMTSPRRVAMGFSSGVRLNECNFLGLLIELNTETASFPILISALNRAEQLSKCTPTVLASLSVW